MLPIKGPSSPPPVHTGKENSSEESEKPLPALPPFEAPRKAPLPPKILPFSDIHKNRPLRKEWSFHGLFETSSNSRSSESQLEVSEFGPLSLPCHLTRERASNKEGPLLKQDDSKAEAVHREGSGIPPQNPSPAITGRYRYLIDRSAHTTCTYLNNALPKDTKGSNIIGSTSEGRFLYTQLSQTSAMAWENLWTAPSIVSNTVRSPSDESSRWLCSLAQYEAKVFVVVQTAAYMCLYCHDILGPEFIGYLCSITPQGKELHSAIWRVWTFCLLFGPGKPRHTKTEALADWLRGGSSMDNLGTADSTSGYFDSTSALELPPYGHGFGDGNCNGLSSQQLDHMRLVCRCVVDALSPAKGGVYAKKSRLETDIFHNPLYGPLLMLEALVPKWTDGNSEPSYYCWKNGSWGSIDRGSWLEMLSFLEEGISLVRRSSDPPTTPENI